MADISKIQVGGVERDIKDVTARNAAQLAQNTANTRAQKFSITDYISSGSVLPSIKDIIYRNEVALSPVVFSSLPSDVDVLKTGTTYVMFRYEYMVNVGKYWKYYIFNYSTKKFVVEYSNSTVPDVIANIP